MANTTPVLNATQSNAYLTAYYPTKSVAIIIENPNGLSPASFIAYDIDGNTLQTGTLSGAGPWTIANTSLVWQGVQGGTVPYGYIIVELLNGGGAPIGSYPIQVLAENITYFPDTSTFSPTINPIGTGAAGSLGDQILHSFMGAGPDREAYERTSSLGNPSGDASYVHTNHTFDLAANGYLYSGYQDSARPRSVFCSDATQGADPGASYYTTLATSMLANGDSAVLIELPTNELSASVTAASLAATVTTGYNAIKAVSTNFKVIGPCLAQATLTSTYIAAFITAMGAVKLDGFTFHIDANTRGDIQYYRNVFGMVKTTLAANGWGSVPVYMTELECSDSNYGISYPRHEISNMVNFELVWEEVFGAAGLGGKENIYYFYDTLHGGYGARVWLKDNTTNTNAGQNSCHANVLAARVLANALAGYPATSCTPLTLSGIGADYLFADVWSNGSGKVLILEGIGLAATVELSLSDAGPFTITDGVGRQTSISKVAGVVNIPVVPDLVSIISLSVSCTISVVDIAGGMLSGGANIIRTASPTLTDQASASSALVGDGVYQTGRYVNPGGSDQYVSGDGAPYLGSAVPGYVQAAFGSSEAINYVAFAATPPGSPDSGGGLNNFCSVLAWSLERNNGGAWTSIASWSSPGPNAAVPAIQNDVATGGGVNTMNFGRISFQPDIWAWGVSLPGGPVTDTAYRLVITTPTWGSEGTLSDADFAGSWYGGSASPLTSQQVVIREMALLAPGTGSAPTVTGISPNGGSTAGGTSVSITGTNFIGATAVKFGTTSASFVVNSATSITATAPAHSAATVDITVTTPAGTSATGAADQFTYTAPGGGAPAPFRG